ncbi:hypothetical protein [Alicyclobacillus ferrooxydans]|uniref:Uncharacterized protein n=1 Tax=Alicyclobacillus ferrooxydans TaxID=471514 RepID=A0A0P9CS48_9BACL|nr:hypothetical protein [Alicyclobacillus ferrooxydans]KPV45641.1 hypothetical protein AN477_01635 [Alicyclobacillus ferrooxydans]
MLYLAFPTDLRDRYQNSQWLVYGKMVSETRFTPEDILVLSEWTIPERMEMVQTLYRVREQGARVIFIGPSQSDTDDFRRQLCLMGVFDFAFFGDEILLGTLDELIEHPRTPMDVKAYMEQGNDALTDLPPVVDVYEADTASEPELADATDESRGFGGIGQLFRRHSHEKGHPSGATAEDGHNGTNIGVRKFVWPNPKAVRVRLLGEPGCGKTFVAWNLAAICNRRELPTAVVEENLLPLTDWTDIKTGVHVVQEAPKKGYRVLLDTRPLAEHISSDTDLVIAVCWADKTRIERLALALHQQMMSPDQVCWVINGHDAALSLPVKLDGDYVVLPNEPRQIAAMRMKRPLADLDDTFSALLNPIADRISEMFIQNSKGGTALHVDAVGI